MAHTSLEAAQEAWAACRPEGYTVAASFMRLALPHLAHHVPGKDLAPEIALQLAELFTPDGNTAPVFWQLLKVRAGRVHFFDFWSAFSKAIRFVANQAMMDEGLSMELETVRDGILRLFDSDVRSDDRASTKPISCTDLVVAIQGAAAMSKVPDFWHNIERNLHEESTDNFSLEDLSAMMMRWLQDAISWQHNESRCACLPFVHDVHNRHAKCLPFAWPSIRGKKKSKSEGLPVHLHIYDVSQEDTVQRINRVFAHQHSPLKFGGVFHAGVEVNGLEWSFGMSECATMPGVSCMLPRSHEAHHYRQTVRLRQTMLSPEDIADLISQVIEEYPGDDYTLLRRNCCHFADDFCRRLGVGGIPGWVHRLARVGALVDSTMQRVLNRRLPLDEFGDDDDDW